VAGAALFQVALAPVLLAQGLWVGARATRLAAPPGPRSGTAGDGPPLRLLILGDSSAAGVGAPDQAQALSGQLVTALSPNFAVTWQLVARSGWRTGQVLTIMRAIPPARYDVAVLALGVNDVTRQVPLGRWLDQQAELAAHLTRARGTRRIFVSGVPPMGLFPALPNPLRSVLGARAERFERALKAACTADPVRRHIAFDPARLRPGMLAEDGFHPSPALYKVWAAELAAAIRQEFTTARPAGDTA